jgi:arylsulfatase A-like enzyme
VFVLTDDQGYPELGCHGHPLIKTPNLDAFHRCATRFGQFHVGPTCAPTRSGLLTGHYANSTGVWHTIGGRSLLRKDEWTLAAALRESGYRTGLFGKWHLGDEYPYRPQDRGFEHAVHHGGGGISQTPDYWGNDYFDDTYCANGQPRRFQGYCTDVFFAEAMKYLEANRDEPVFCYISTNAPHGPYNVPPRYRDLYRNCGVPEEYARFLGMITNIDENFGKLRAHLQRLGLEEDTILVFMSDNGPCGGARREVENPYNAGMRGYKGSEYDGGHRVPFFLRWPNGGLEEALDINELTAYVDFMPTLLDLCGVPVPAGRTFHGQSLAPLLRGETGGAWRERVLVTDSQRVPYPLKWKQSAAMKNTWRLVNGRELYDVASDPAQQHDLAADHPDQVAELRAGYERWWETVSQQFDEEIPISLGAEGEAEACLTTHDWRNDTCDCAWNQAFVRKGQVCNGYWEVQVERPGVYEFELRRWPREAGHALATGIDGDDIEWHREGVSDRSRDHYTGGTALPIRRACLKVTGHPPLSTDVAPDDTAAVLEVELKPGPAHVQTWLTDGSNFNVGAYYVYVRRK